MRPFHRLAAALALLAALAPPGARAAHAQPATALCRAPDRPAASYNPQLLSGGGAIVQAATDVGAQTAVGTVANDTLRCVGRTMVWGTGADGTQPVRAYLHLPDSGVFIAIGDYTGATMPQAHARAAQAILAAWAAGVLSVDTLALLVPNSAHVPPSYLGVSGRPQALPLTGISRTPELPRRLIDTRPPAFGPGCRRLPVVGTTMAAVQAAADSARGCDVVELAPGQSYGGILRWRRRSGLRYDGVITIATRGADTLAPAVGERVTAAHAAQFAHLRVTANNNPVVQIDSAAYGWRLFAVTLDAAPTIKRGSRFVNANGETWRNGSTFPRRIAFDRVAMIGHDSLNTKRCALLDAADVVVVDSYLAGCHEQGAEAQAINIISGPGGYAIVNNLVEGAGENLMLCGAAPRYGNPYYGGTLVHTVSDLEIARNHFFKPLWWKGKWLVKNLFELKCGERIVGYGNVFENSWVDGQVGYAWTFKRSVVWQASRITVADVTMRWNRIYNAPIAMALTAFQSDPTDSISAYHRPMTRVLIAYTVADSLTDKMVLINAGDSVKNRPRPQLRDLALVHNSFLGRSAASPSPCTTNIQFGTLGRWGDRLTISHNVWQKCKYGIANNNTTSAALAERFASYEFAGNVLGGFPTAGYTGNDRSANAFYGTFAAALAALGLAPPGTATAGADVARVRAATWGVQPATLAR